MIQVSFSTDRAWDDGYWSVLRTIPGLAALRRHGQQPNSVPDRFAIHFDRIVTPRFTRDVDELRTWNTRIR